MSEEEIKLDVLKKRILRCVEQLRKFRKFLENTHGTHQAYILNRYSESIRSEIDESVHLVFEYNQLKDFPKVRDCGKEEIRDKDLGELSAYIKNILRELETAGDYIYSYLKSKDMTEAEQSKIKWAEEELEKLKKNECDLNILQNLEEALNEGASGHYLACGIISARVIDHILQFIKKKEGLSNENLNEQIIEKLRELEVVKKDEIAGQDKKEFLDAAKSARDAVSHKIKFMPNGPKSFSLLSYAFIISDLFVKYLERKNE
ncbi:MAG: hypothetical protein ACOCUU_02435 [Nanoarchaeota archaeon]